MTQPVENCIFCKIVAGEIPAKKVYEDERIIAFHDIQPQANVHVLIIPKKHIPTMMDVQEEDFSLIADIHRTAQQLGKEIPELAGEFRVANNCGKTAGQEVFHLHYHVLGGQKLGRLNAGPA